MPGLKKIEFDITNFEEITKEEAMKIIEEQDNNSSNNN